MLNAEPVKEVNGSGVFSLGSTDLDAVARELQQISHKMRSVLNTFLMGATFAERVPSATQPADTGDGESMSALIKSNVEQFTALSIRLDDIARSLSRHQDR